ncbi:pre-rRNA-processing protein pno1 [Pseudogymnoascus australis]
MSAPTALLRNPEEIVSAPEAIPLPQIEDEELILDTEMDVGGVSLIAPTHGRNDHRRRRPPSLRTRPKQRRSRPDRLAQSPDPTSPHVPLKNEWPKIYPPLVEHLKLQVRMNVPRKAVELRTSKFTTDTGALQKGEDFVKAFTLGFDTDDAIALLRLDDLYIETFEIKDVKTLQGEHLGRAIGRIAGKDGKTKFAIENASKTRVVLADSKIHILGGFKNIRIAREAIVSLILGSPPGKVYGNLRKVASRMKERF